MDQPSPLTADAPVAWARPAVLVPLFMLVSLVGGALPSFTLGANGLVLLTGGWLFRLGMSGRLPRHPAPGRRPAGLAWWLVPGAVLAGIELLDFALGSTYAHPTVSGLLDPLLAGYSGRAAAYFAWLLGFWGLARR